MEKIQISDQSANGYHGDGRYFMEHKTAKSTYLKIIQDELTAWPAGDPEPESCTLVSVCRRGGRKAKPTDPLKQISIY